MNLLDCKSEIHCRLRLQFKRKKKRSILVQAPQARGPLAQHAAPQAHRRFPRDHCCAIRTYTFMQAGMNIVYAESH